MTMYYLLQRFNFETQTWMSPGLIQFSTETLARNEAISRIQISIVNNKKERYRILEVNEKEIIDYLAFPDILK